MNSSLSEILKRIRKSVNEDDFLNICYSVVEEIEERDDAFEAVEYILRVIEENPNADFGNPGPLVHFLEKYYEKGYEEKLVESIKRSPTVYNVWMLNRILNAVKGKKKEDFIKVLLEIVKNPNLDKDVLSLTNEFISMHS